MAEQILIINYTGAALAAPANNLVRFDMPAGTVSRIYTRVGSNLSGGTATFNAAKNGVDLFTTTGRLIIPENDLEFDKTGLSISFSDGDELSFDLEAIAATVADLPYTFRVYYDDGLPDPVLVSGAQSVAGVKTFTDPPIVPTPAGATDAANKTYVDSAIAGLSWKTKVRVATTANGTLATDFENGDTIDGVVLATGDRILIKDQSTATANGIYIVAATGAPTRATDADSGAELVNASCYVSEGTANADKQFVCTTNAPITIGATNITFTEFTSGGGGGDALTTNPLSQFAATTSAQLAGVLSDETGTGAAVFANSPTLITPALGTPASGVATNLTGLPTTGLVDAAVTYAKMQNVSAASRLTGRGSAGGAGVLQEITLGTNLSMSGTTLNATGGGGSGTFDIDDGTSTAGGVFTFDDGDST